MLFAFALFTTTLASQIPASPSDVLNGVVHDSQHRVVADADVEVRCGAVTRQTTTDGRGEFTVAALPEGVCRVSAQTPTLAPTELRVQIPSTAAVAIVIAPRGVASEVVVTATRGTAETIFNTPAAASVVTREDLRARPHRLLMQALREEPGVLVQQTTTAQTSPIIRGFTGQSNVYLLDGVRLNTASWRPGPSQYTAWVDGALASRIEIVRGPGSVHYGSDALGGTINILPATPMPSAGGLRFGGEVAIDASTADAGRGGEAQLLVDGSAAAFRIGLSAQRVGELRPGNGVDSHAAVTRYLGMPSTAFYSKLPNTGFDQTSAFATGNIRLGPRRLLTTLLLHQSLTGTFRYDRMDGGDGLHRSGFDPQRLDFGVLRYRHQLADAMTEWSATLSVNRQSDGRYEQTRPTAVLDTQRAVTTAIGYHVDGRRLMRGHDVQVGAELYREGIDAARQQINALTGVSVPNRPDIPDGTGYDTAGVFASDAVDFGRVHLRGGIRYGRYVFTTAEDLRLGVVRDRVVQQTVTFNAASVIRLAPALNATFNVARGFRAANSADLGSIGLTGGGGFEIAPSRAAALGGHVGTTAAAGAISTGVAVPGLGPEVVYSFEPGIRFRSGRYTGAVTAFHMEYLDSIQRRAIVFPAGIVGTSISGFDVVRQDANGLAYIAQDLRPIVTRANVDRSRIFGVELEGTAAFGDRWATRAYWSMSDGHVVGTGEYLRRMPPPLGGASLRWSARRLWVEGTTSFAAAQTRFNSGDFGDARIGGSRTRAAIGSFFNGTAVDRGYVRNGVLVATGETLPQVQQRVLGDATAAPMFTRGAGFLVLGARAGVALSDGIELSVLGENLTDENYRLFGSGHDAAGVHVQARLRYRF